MRIIKSLLYLLIIVLIFIHCGPSVTVTRFTTSNYAPKTGDIDIYTTTANIKKPYKEIALIQVKEEDTGDIMEALIAKAKSLGADGVIILEMGEVKTGGVYIPPKNNALGYGTYTSSTRGVVKGTAIVYEDKKDSK